MNSSVIVGVDGSPSAARAAELAGDLAVRHRLPLAVIHAYSWPSLYPPFLPPSIAVDMDPRRLAREIVDTVATAVGRRCPQLSVDTRIVDGNAAGALVDASRHATFLVVGHRGLGGFAELLVGSVGVHTTAHAHCPVLVVRGDPGAPDTPVVVGVDGSSQARTAAGYAFEEARVRGADLHVVLARSAAPRDGAAVDPVEVRLTGLAGRYPDVKVHRAVRPGESPALVISSVAREVGAGLIVVGSRGIGGFRGLLVGGTGRALVDHAPCPVMVIPIGAAPRFKEA